MIETEHRLPVSTGVPGGLSRSGNGVPFRRPGPWQQRMQFIPLGPPGDDTFQHIRQPCPWLDVIQLGSLDQRRHDGPMPSAAVSVGEQRIFPFMSTWT